MPVLPGQAEATARILERLSEELAEAAAMLRQARLEASAMNCRVSNVALPGIRPGSRPPGMRSGGRPGAFPSFHELV
jgi:hypothetical protein